MPDLDYWRKLPAHRRWLLLEALATLLAARVALRTIPYKRLTWYFQRRPRQPERSGAARVAIKQDVRWAIIVLARRYPQSIVCFPRAVAAQAMLRRRGISTTLYYGAKRHPQRGLTTHAWLQDGEDGIIGILAAPGHKVLARYPAA